MCDVLEKSLNSINYTVGNLPLGMWQYKIHEDIYPEVIMWVRQAVCLFHLSSSHLWKLLSKNVLSLTFFCHNLSSMYYSNSTGKTFNSVGKATVPIPLNLISSAGKGFNSWIASISSKCIPKNWYYLWSKKNTLSSLELQLDCQLLPLLYTALVCDCFVVTKFPHLNEAIS